MLKEYNGFKVGDKVRIVDSTRTFPSYESMFKHIANNVDVDCVNFILNKLPLDGEEGVIMALEKHPDNNNRILALVKVGNIAYIINILGLEKVKRHGLIENAINKTYGLKDDTQVYFILDVSSSMDIYKTNMAYGIYEQYRKDYANIKIITHSSEAKWNNEEGLKVDGGSGGTYLSSGLSLAITDSMSNGYKNCIFVQVCDGDNWAEDSEGFLNSISIIKGSNHKYHYFEVMPATFGSNMFSKINNRVGASDNVVTLKFNNMEELRKHYNLGTLKKYTVYQVEHKVGGKLYQFRSQYELRSCEMVTCVTAQGNTYGRIKNILTKEMTENEYNELALCEYIR